MNFILMQYRTLPVSYVSSKHKNVQKKLYKTGSISVIDEGRKIFQQKSEFLCNTWCVVCSRQKGYTHNARCGPM